MKFITSALLTSLLIFACLTPSLAQSDFSEIDIDDGTRFTCGQDDVGNFLVRYTRRGKQRFWRFSRGIGISKELKRYYTRRLRRATRRGNQSKITRFTSLVSTWKEILADIRACRSETGDFTFNGGGGNNISACTVTSNPTTAPALISAALSDEWPTSQIINGNVCSVGSSPVVELL